MAKPESIKLKKYSLDNLKAEEKQYYRKIEGLDSFFVRVIPSGVKTWYFIYRVGGRKKYLNLGNYPAVSLEEARNNYNAAFKQWEKGADPAQISRQEKEDNLKASTVSELVTNYIERHAKRFKRSWQEDERILNKEVIPVWGQRKAADVKKRDVLALLETIVGRKAPGAANNTFQVVRKMFNFAVEQDILPFTPCAMVKLPAPKNSRKRVLSEAEIKVLWKKLDAPDLMISSDSRRALKLILVTGQRGGEVCGMHTKEIDGKWWTIPVDRQKVPKTMENKRSPHRVYLTGLATELIGKTDVIDSATGETAPKGFISPRQGRRQKWVPMSKLKQ